MGTFNSHQFTISRDAVLLMDSMTKTFRARLRELALARVKGESRKMISEQDVDAVIDEVVAELVKQRHARPDQVESEHSRG